MNMGNEKTLVLVYNTVFVGSGIRHSNAGLQSTHDIFTARYFVLLFDLTPDRAASEGHISLPDQGNIRLDLQFDKPLPEAATCLPYIEYDNCFRINQLGTVSVDFYSGHGANTLYAKGRTFISRHVSVRHSAAISFSNTIRDSYRK